MFWACDYPPANYKLSSISLPWLRSMQRFDWPMVASVKLV
ncbi:hypothetical protein Z949_1958 [Sulfitobacter guttiformis KCTC 32187]|nr:hypothetical protein Z949_1958 [Sulfitobacter guttiformis KCTC 32187]